MSKHDTDNAQAPIPPSASDPNAIDYYSSQRKQRNKKKTLAIVIASIGCAVALVGVAVFAWAMGIQRALNEGVNDDLRSALSDSTSVDDPFYMLLLGVDRNKDRAASAEYGDADSAYRSDSIILARIDPPEKQVTLVSLHRDLLIDMDEHGTNKLNAAYSIGGPAYVVKVVSELADVPISHYAEVNFDEFDALVDTLGGIEVDVPMDINDPLAGAPIKAGPQTLDGAQALTLCRSRHAYDNYGDGDVYRAANQRMVIAAIAQKVMNTDPATLVSTISQLASMVTTDFSVSDLVHLATEMKGIDTEKDLYTGMTPTTSTYVNETWYELLIKDAWQTMMTRVDRGLSPYSSADEDQTVGLAGTQTVNVKNGEGNVDNLTFDTSTIATHDATVLVLNGARIDGLANRIANTLDTYGFKTSTGNAVNQYEASFVAYLNEGSEADAQAVAESLGGELPVENWIGQYEADADVLLVLGPDMAGSVDQL